MSKSREVFVYYEDTIPASVYPPEFPKPYDDDGVLFREVTPQDGAKDQAITLASTLIGELMRYARAEAPFNCIKIWEAEIQRFNNLAIGNPEGDKKCTMKTNKI